MNKKLLLGGSLVALSSLMLVACGSKGSSSSKSSGDIKIWSAKLQPATTISDWKHSPFHTGLEKATGIKADWEFPTEGTDEAQAFNLMTSESELPDIIQYPMASSAEQNIKDGVIKDLTKILPKKAPHYWKFLKEHPDFDRAVKTDSGKYYTFGFFRADVITATHLGPMVRKDWLKEQGLSSPKTLDEIENVLKVFKAKYNARLGFTSGRMSPGFAGAFGAYGTFGLSGYIDKAGKIQVAQVQPEWKSYMTWLHKLYSEGLIDPDVVTMADSDLQTEIQNNKVGMTMTTAGTMTTYEENAKASGSKAEWEGIQYPNQDNGQKTSTIYYDQLVNSYGFEVGGTTSGKKLDKAMKWLDWAYTDAGQKYWNFGTKGKSYTDVNGQPEFSKTITDSKLGTYESLRKYTGNVDLGLGIQNVKVVEARMSDDAMAASKLWYNDNKDALAVSPSKQISYTADESKELATITNNISTYISETSTKFMTGEKSLSDYDSFVAKIKGMGLSKYLKIRQAALDRYNKR